MFCTKCGKELREGSAFCVECSTKVREVQSGTNESPQPVGGYTYTGNQGEPYQPVSSAEKVGFVEAVKIFFENYANFEGRATKEEFWWAFLFNFLASFVVGVIPYVGAVLSLVLLIPGLSNSVRRLHDTGKSWTYLLMGFIPLAGVVLLIIQYCKDSDGDNKWGPAR